jgi:hypothetical protein
VLLVLKMCDFLAIPVFPIFKVLRHEEFKEGCDAACNG